MVLLQNEFLGRLAMAALDEAETEVEFALCDDNGVSKPESDAELLHRYHTCRLSTFLLLFAQSGVGPSESGEP